MPGVLASGTKLYANSILRGGECHILEQMRLTKYPQTVIETSTENELRKAGEVDLSRDEDSVMSLAVRSRNGKKTYLYAGVNSSPAAMAKGQNQHLRTLTIEQSKSRASVGTKIPDVRVSEISRSTFFANPSADTYQRLLRVSGDMGAAATAMGKEPQLAIFDISGGSPKVKGVLDLPQDAVDLDIFQMESDQYQTAFCYKDELHVINLGPSGTSEPEKIFTMPTDNGEKPVFRSIRYLSQHFIMAAANLPNKSGILLLGLRLPSKGHPRARMAATHRVPRAISATSLSVTNLSPPSSPGALVPESQSVIAVAGHDSSIILHTVTIQQGSAVPFLLDLLPFATIKEVHGSGQITGLDFSQFITPKTHVRAQSVKLASISLQQTVAVHSIPLKKFVDKTPRNKKAPPRATRYVVALKSQRESRTPVIIALSVVVLVMAVVYQGIMEMYGQTSLKIVHPERFFSWHGTQRTFNPPPPGLAEQEIIKRIGLENAPDDGQKLIMVETDHPDDVNKAEGEEKRTNIGLHVHDEDVHGEAKEWNDLPHHQKEAWKERLQDAGHWTQHMGDSVFQGVLFGELAGVVAQVVG